MGAAGTKDLNEALIFGVAFVFFVSFFDSEGQEVVPPMQKNLTTLDGTTRGDTKKIFILTAYLS